MRALLTTAALVATLAACATRPASIAPAPQPDVDVPLSARLFPPQYGQLAVGLNKPAFVAIFEVVPGRGASLVYPTGGTGFTPVLQTWVPLRYNPQRWIYTNQSYGHAAWYQRGGLRYAGGNSGWANAYGANGGPRYFFMVASEDPIAVEQFQEGTSAVRRYLGVSYDSWRPYDVMEDLAYALLPYATDERWVTDVVVDWGYDWGNGYGPMAAYSYARWEPVMCADGSVRMARYVSGWGYDNLPCTLYGNAQPPVLPIDPSRPGTPLDSVDGRDRDPAPNDEPRTRQRSGGTVIADTDMSDADVRRRIAELREQAGRARFNEELREELRSSVSTRRRIDQLRGGRNALSGGDDRTVRTSPSRAADEAYRRAEASRPRERGARSGQPTRTTAGSPRGRSGDGGSARPASSGGSERSTRAGSGSSERSRSGGSASSGGSSGSGSSARPSSSSGSSGSGRSRIPPA